MCNTIIKELSDSAMFQLSLANNELFHSNFLYWLAKKYPQNFVQILLGLNCQCTWGSQKWEIFREKNHYDLAIYLNGKVVFILENKTKAIPTIEQLRNYSNGVSDNCDLLLLTMPGVSLAINPQTTGKWEQIDYGILSQEIRKHCLSSKIITNNDKVIICEYCKSIESFHDLSRDWATTYSNGATTFSERTKDEDTYKNLRINDLREKLWSSCLLNNLRDKLNGKNLVSYTKIEQFVNDKNFIDKIHISHGFSRTTGLIEAKVKISDEYVMLVQIQGNTYKHGVEWINGNCDITQRWIHTQNLCSFNDWMVSSPAYSQCIFTNQNDFATGRKGLQFCSYDSHNSKFIYRYKQIKPCATINQVIDVILNDINHMQSVQRILTTKKHNNP